VNGRIRVAQRFAVDWERLDAPCRIYNGPQQALASYAIHGQSALYAVCASAARSIPLKAGERVRRRHVLGKVGNTGNSVATHLHFRAIRALTAGCQRAARPTTSTRFGSPGTPLALTTADSPRTVSNSLPMDQSSVRFSE